MPKPGSQIDDQLADHEARIAALETAVADLQAQPQPEPDPQPQPEPDPTPDPTPEPEPEPDPQPEPDPSIDARRPYGPNAPWNIPLAGIAVHDRNDELCDLLWNDTNTDRPDRNFNINNNGYTYPIYEVQPDTPMFPVVSANPSWGNLHGTEIPFDPAWKAAPGTDAQIIILDPATGREWNLHKVNFDGTTVNINNGNLIPGSYWTREVGFPSSRGCGIMYLAMLVRPWEIEAGVIQHALSMPVLHTSGTEYFPPATKIEHPNHPYGIPEGARYSLDVTDAEIDAHLASLPCPDLMKTRIRPILVAMRDYGWIITDTAGGNPIQLEDRTTAGDAWDALGMANFSADGKVYPRDALDKFITRERMRCHVTSDAY